MASLVPTLLSGLAAGLLSGGAPPTLAAAAVACTRPSARCSQDSSEKITGPMRAFVRDELPGLLAESGVPGLAVVIVEQGRTTLCEGLGLADREAEAPVTADTLFNVGSISKSVAAWVVLHRVDAGELDLQAALPQLLEELPFEADERAGGVTLQRLLSHTAGIGLPSVSGYDVVGEVPTLREELARLVAIEGEPGAGYAYSGGGYGLIQLIVEERFDSSFAAEAERTVLAPLGMQASRFGIDEEARLRLATPYQMRNAEGHAERVGTRVYPIEAAAGFITSARDMGRFLAAHMEGPEGQPAGRGVVSPATLKLMGSPCPPATNYGLGYELPKPFQTHAVLMHNGTNLGWKAHFMVLPDLRVGIAVLANGDGSSLVRDVLFRFRNELLKQFSR